MAKAENISYKKFQEIFHSEKVCQEYLFKSRWKNGFACPKCGCVEFYHISDRGLYQCKSCRHQWSCTTGTVMHRSHLPLLTWFWAIYLVSKDKRGYSALQLSKELDLPYNTAWFLLHRIRHAMGERDQMYQLFGTIELDDTYIGSLKRGGKRGRGSKKTKIVVAVSKSKKGKPQYVKMTVVQNLKSKTIEKFALKNILKESTVQTDAYHSYRKPLVENYKHQYEVFDSDGEMLRWLHMIISNAKAFVNGTFHGLGEKHLQRYLDEFCYRFNRRFLECNLFDNLLTAITSASPLTFAELS